MSNFDRWEDTPEPPTTAASAKPTPPVRTMSHAEKSRLAAAYMAWQRHLIEEPMPAEETAKKYNVSTVESWQSFKLVILRFSLYGSWGMSIKPRYSLLGADMNVSERTAQRIITAARELGWLLKVKQASSRGYTAVWQINDPVVEVDDDDFDVIESAA